MQIKSEDVDDAEGSVNSISEELAPRESVATKKKRGDLESHNQSFRISAFIDEDEQTYQLDDAQIACNLLHEVIKEKQPH